MRKEWALVYRVWLYVIILLKGEGYIEENWRNDYWGIKRNR